MICKCGKHELKMPMEIENGKCIFCSMRDTARAENHSTAHIDLMEDFHDKEMAKRAEERAKRWNG